MKIQYQVALIMGSDSDWSTMKAAKEVLDEFQITVLKRVVSAHRTPEDLGPFAQEAEELGIKVIIAGAGGAAHLPGMIASYTHLPVIGVPVNTTSLNGMDSLLSIVQMPAGIPVATVGVGNSKNAGLLAARIISTFDSEVAEKLVSYRSKLAQASRLKTNKLGDDNT